MKKKLLIASLLLLIIAVIIAYSREQGSSVKIAGEDKYNRIKEQTVSLEEEFVLSFNGEALPYDASSKTFYLPVDMEDAAWEIGHFTGLFYGEEEAELIFLESYQASDKQAVIAEGRGFPFLAVTGKGYGEYQLVFTGLPMMTFTGTEYLAEDGPLTDKLPAEIDAEFDPDALYPSWEATDFYHHYEEDIALFAEMGWNVFRMSINWSISWIIEFSTDMGVFQPMPPSS